MGLGLGLILLWNAAEDDLVLALIASSPLVLTALMECVLEVHFD